LSLIQEEKSLAFIYLICPENKSQISLQEKKNVPTPEPTAKWWMRRANTIK
jgi:hypothetical protein